MTTKGTVLFITPQPFFSERGSPLRVRATVRSLAALGFNVDLLCLPFGLDPKLPGIRVLRSLRLPGIKDIPIGPSWSKFALDLFLLAKAFQLVFHNRYCKIHGIEEGGVIAAILGKLFKIPYVFDMHSCMSDQLQEGQFFKSNLLIRTIIAIEHLCVKGAFSVMTVCDDLTSRMKVVAPHVPAYTVEDVALDELPEPNTVRINELRDQFKLQDRKVLVYTGNFGGYQGIDLLLDGFAAAKRSVPPDQNSIVNKAVLLLVGGDPEGSPRRVELEEKALKLGISDAVIFAGSRPTNEMNDFMSLADVLVSPRTLGVNTPLKVYSYMAAGKAIVATNIKSHTQILNSSCAYLCDPTPEGLAIAIKQSLDQSPASTADRSQKIDTATKLADDKYSIKQFIKNIAAVHQVSSAN